MTPKEKAEELKNKYSRLCIYGTDAFYEKLAPEIREFIKQCALIAVDEIIDNIDGFLEARIWALNYWQEVKQEIEKL